MSDVALSIWDLACPPAPSPPTYLELDPQHGRLPGQAEDVVVPEPEVPSHGAEALLVLPPVAVEGRQAHLAPLDDCPATAVAVHVAEHLAGERRGA